MAQGKNPQLDYRNTSPPKIRLATIFFIKSVKGSTVFASSVCNIYRIVRPVKYPFKILENLDPSPWPKVLIKGIAPVLAPSICGGSLQILALFPSSERYPDATVGPCGHAYGRIRSMCR
jgi:hypothetical protein